MSFRESQRQLTEPLTAPHGFTDVSRYANAPLPDKAIAHIVDLLIDRPYRTPEAHGIFTMFGWVGGVLTATPRDATAYVHRDLRALLRPGAIWEPDAAPEVSDELIA